MNASASRSILITGCSSGIGYAAAVTLRERGWRVFATCRKEADCARLDSEGFESFRIDYELPETIAAGAEEALQRTGGNLDALYNNGAYAIPGAVEDLPVEALRILFEANFFGWHDLTRRVLPAMRRQGKGRIVQCSSVLGFIGLPMRGAYVATKFALEGLSHTLRQELRDTDIHVSLIEPGPIATKFVGNCKPHFLNWIDRENTPWREAYVQLLRRLEGKLPPLPSTLPAGAVVDKLVHALESPRPRPRYYVTRSTYLAGYAQRLFSTRWLDAVLLRSW